MSTHLRVRVGREHYAVPIAAVREVELLGEPTPVPGTGAHVAGVRALRGELLPVLRLARLLGIDAGAPSRIVVVEDAGRRAGLAVDAIDDIERIADDELTAASSPLTSGAVVAGERLVGVLDVAAALDAATAVEAA
ncbi:chemotaxis protein CheW [Patulibacter sp. S7RM1-6]